VKVIVLPISTVQVLGLLVLNCVNNQGLERGLQQLSSQEKERDAHRSVVVNLAWALVSIP